MYGYYCSCNDPMVAHQGLIPPSNIPAHPHHRHHRKRRHHEHRQHHGQAPCGPGGCPVRHPHHGRQLISPPPQRNGHGRLISPAPQSGQQPAPVIPPTVPGGATQGAYYVRQNYAPVPTLQPIPGRTGLPQQPFAPGQVPVQHPTSPKKPHIPLYNKPYYWPGRRTSVNMCDCL